MDINNYALPEEEDNVQPIPTILHRKIVKTEINKRQPIPTEESTTFAVDIERMVSELCDSKSEYGVAIDHKSVANEIVHLAIDGCMLAENIASNNKQRPCFKNIQNICEKSRLNAQKPDAPVPNLHSQGIPWVIKNFIFAFVRILDGWRVVKELLNEKHSSYARIENSYYSPNIRECFYEWQRVTQNMLYHIYNTFKNLDVGMQAEQKKSKQRSDEPIAPVLQFSEVLQSIAKNLDNTDTKDWKNLYEDDLQDLPTLWPPIDVNQYKFDSEPITKSDFSSFQELTRLYSRQSLITSTPIKTENTTADSTIEKWNSNLDWETAKNTAHLFGSKTQHKFNNTYDSKTLNCSNQNKKWTSGSDFYKKKTKNNNTSKKVSKSNEYQLASKFKDIFDSLRENALELDSELSKDSNYKSVNYFGLTISDIVKRLNENHYATSGEVLQNIELWFKNIEQLNKVYHNEDVNLMVCDLKADFYNKYYEKFPSECSYKMKKKKNIKRIDLTN